MPSSCENLPGEAWHGRIDGENVGEVLENEAQTDSNNHVEAQTCHGEDFCQ